MTTTLTGKRPTNLPLSPYRVLDLTDDKGFLCGRLLADMGADVLKIEPPGGDPARRHGPFYHDEADPEKSLTWFAFNLNKRGITLDLASADGRSIFQRLAATADFVVESFAPGYMDGLGLGFEALRAINPRTVVTSITPFGQTGPYRDYRADDIVSGAVGGLLAITGEPGRPPLRVGVPLAFATAASQAAAGTMIAHYHRLRTGQGRHVDVSIQEAVCDTLHSISQSWYLDKKVLPRGSRDYGGHVPRDTYPVKDGYVNFQIYFGPGTGTRMRGLGSWMAAEGYDAEVGKVDFNKLTGRTISKEQLERWEDEVAEFLSRFTKQEVYAHALRHRVFLFPVASPADLAEDKQLAARGFFRDVRHPELDASLRYPGPFGVFSVSPIGIYRKPPLIGEHNLEVYGEELGYSADELRMLKETGVI